MVHSRHARPTADLKIAYETKKIRLPLITRGCGYFNRTTTLAD
jgi:hypothetical protein